MKNEKNQQNTKTAARIMLFITGIIALVFATMCFAIPDNITSITGLDKDTTNILAIALTVIGFADLFASLVLFKPEDRK